MSQFFKENKHFLIISLSTIGVVSLAGIGYIYLRHTTTKATTTTKKNNKKNKSLFQLIPISFFNSFNNDKNDEKKKKTFLTSTTSPNEVEYISKESFANKNYHLNLKSNKLEDWWMNIVKKNQTTPNHVTKIKAKIKTKLKTPSTPTKTVSTLNEDDHLETQQNEAFIQVNKTIERSNEIYNHFKKDETSALPLDDIKLISNELVDQFETIYSNKQLKLTPSSTPPSLIDNLEKTVDILKSLLNLTEIEQVKNDFKLSKIHSILTSSFNNKTNSDLFEKYQFNNKSGELKTDLLLLFLRLYSNIITFKCGHLDQSDNESDDYKNYIQTDKNYEFIDVLFIFMTDLIKNRNNVMRLKKIDSIRLLTLRILRKELIISNINSSTVDNLHLITKIYLNKNYLSLEQSTATAMPSPPLNSLQNKADFYEFKFNHEFTINYYKLVKYILTSAIRCLAIDRIVINKIDNSAPVKQFGEYLQTDSFYDQLNKSFRFDTSTAMGTVAPLKLIEEYQNERRLVIEPLFKHLIEFRDKILNKPEKETEAKEEEKEKTFL
jgi:hypothetical protein